MLRSIRQALLSRAITRQQLHPGLQLTLDAPSFLALTQSNLSGRPDTDENAPRKSIDSQATRRTTDKRGKQVRSTQRHDEKK